MKRIVKFTDSTTRPKLTKTIWVNKLGQRIKVKDMTDSHLINTIKLIRRSSEVYRDRVLISLFQGYGFLNGEMAIDALEFEIKLWENMDELEIAYEMLGVEIYETMINEADNRGLKIENELKSNAKNSK